MKIPDIASKISITTWANEGNMSTFYLFIFARWVPTETPGPRSAGPCPIPRFFGFGLGRRYAAISAADSRIDWKH